MSSFADGSVLIFVFFLRRPIAQPATKRAFLSWRTRIGGIEAGSGFYCSCSRDDDSCTNSSDYCRRDGIGRGGRDEDCARDRSCIRNLGEGNGGGLDGCRCYRCRRCWRSDGGDGCLCGLFLHSVRPRIGTCSSADA